MNIAIVIPTIEAGGAEKQAVLLAKCLSPTHKVFFYVFFGNLPKEKKHLETLSSSGVELISLVDPIIRKTRKLTRSLKDNCIDVAFNYLTMCDCAGCYAERRAKVKYIFNGIRNAHLARWKEVIERFCNNHWASGTIFNSYSAENFFSKRGFDKRKLIVIQNCFPDIAYAFERPQKEIITVITVGRFDPAKDYETSIKSVAEAYAQNPNIQYVIVGYGDLESNIRQWVKQYGIQDITDIYINPTNIPELLHDADIFLTTSLYEGTSNAVMEALNACLPVVCTNVGDNENLVKNGESGYIHNVSDFNAISESLVRLAGDYGKRLSFGIAANRILCENFSVEIFQKKYEDILYKCK